MIQTPDHDLAEWRLGSGHWQKEILRVINLVQSKNRARPMNALLKINPVQSNNRARPMAVRLINILNMVTQTTTRILIHEIEATHNLANTCS